jgi:hypothetical protein
VCCERGTQVPPVFVPGDVGGGPSDEGLEAAFAMVGHSFEYPRLV